MCILSSQTITRSRTNGLLSVFRNDCKIPPICQVMRVNMYKMPHIYVYVAHTGLGCEEEIEQTLKKETNVIFNLYHVSA